VQPANEARVEARIESRMGARIEARIGDWGRFESPALEEQYRVEQVKQEAGGARSFIWVALATFLTFAISDYRLLGTTGQLGFVLGARLAVVMLSLIALTRLRKDSAPRDFDRTLFAWGVVATALRLYIAWTRPGGEFANHVFVNVTMVLLIYVAFPLTLRLQAILAAGFAAANIFLFVFLNPLADGLARLALATAVVVANVMGLVISRNSHHMKRQRFAATLREAELRESLDRSLAEIKTLRGILPICAHCKRVRDDAGYWQKVEVYVRDRTHAEFSHGICPQCAKLHWGEAGQAGQAG